MRSVPPARRLALAALLAADAVLFVFAARALSDGPRRLVDATQVELGEALRLSARLPGVDPTFRMPVVPLLESDALLRLGPKSLPAAVVALYALSALLVAALGFSVGGATGGAAAALAWQAIFAAMPRSPGFAKQFAFTPLVALAALALARRAERPSPAGSAAAGAAVGASLLCRGVLGPFAPLWLAHEAASPGRPAVRAARAAAFAAAIAATLAPWWAMNARVHGRFVPLENGAADRNLVAGALGQVGPVEGEPSELAGAPTDWNGGSAAGWALRAVVARPAPFLRGVARRVAFYAGLRPLLLAMAVLGAFLVRRPATRTLAALAAYWIAVHSLMPVEADYLAPLWPVLCALAAAPLSLWPGPDERTAARAARFAGLAGAAFAGFLVARCGVDALAYAARVRASAGADAADEAASRGEPWGYYLRARWSLRSGDARRALADLERARPALGDLPRFRLAEALARARLGRTSALLEEADDAPAPFNDDLWTLPLHRAAMLRAIGRPAAARAALDDARERDAARHGALGEATGDDREVDERLKDAARASFARRAATAFASEEPGEAESLGEALAEPDYWRTLAALRRSDGDAAGSRRALRGFERSARAAEDWRQLSLAWADDGSPREARAAVERALSLAPRDAQALSDRAMLRWKAGDRSGAESDLRRALDIDPGLPEADLSLGTIREGQARPAEARALYERALGRAIDDPRVESALREALSRVTAPAPPKPAPTPKP